ncbi:hypothetical protein QAD02_023519 [Eretmocerus hayati]|uniref:Uncharacterized protein n=1 Tax=Eretmocerus hayati TaxID=131215 RepID=A0ACC2PWD2_9HYME|nr:hypothetical protein QAD02_023519 [Eretmocerus hayati]
MKFTILLSLSATVGITGGNDEAIEDYPYTVIIEHYKPDHRSCTGAIISEHYVLTTADCLKNINEKTIVRSRSSHLWNKGTEHWINTYDSRDWNGFTSGGIALIRVSQPFLFDDIYKPIGLFEKNEIIKPGTIASVSGWTSNTSSDHIGLQAINVTISEQKYCGNEMLCAINPNYPGQFMSYGDEGNPLVIKGRLAGLLFQWTRSSTQGAVDGYLPIANYRDRIDAYTKNDV